MLSLAATLQINARIYQWQDKTHLIWTSNSFSCIPGQSGPCGSWKTVVQHRELTDWSDEYILSAIITQPRFILCRCRSQTFKVCGKQSHLMQLALWQAEVSSHIKAKLRQQQKVEVMLQLWHGGTNNTHIPCRGYVTFSKTSVMRPEPTEHGLW